MSGTAFLLIGLGLVTAGEEPEPVGPPVARRPASAPAEALESAFARDIQPLLQKYCHACHGSDLAEADLDLTSFEKFSDVRQRAKVLQKIREMLDSGQMPPRDAKQPTADEHARLQQWVRDVLKLEAAARAGDPGPVLLRRLSNAEYTYTLRDLTGLDTLDPAREFPVDSAAGEGFTNVGNALVMSPALVTKYLDAAKGVASHAVLLPDGVRFSPFVTRRDWTNERLTAIRNFYGEFSAAGGGSAVNLHGIQFNTNQGGRLPLEKYLAALLEERQAIAGGQKSLAAVARERGLSAKYLTLLWQTLTTRPAVPSQLLDDLRKRWQDSGPADVAALLADITAWQNGLWKFSKVGHIGIEHGGQAWMEPVTPLASRHELRLKIPESPPGDEVVLYLAAGDAGDGGDSDFIVWERPRFVIPGRPDLMLKDVRQVADVLFTRRREYLDQTEQCLEAAAVVSAATTPVDLGLLAAKHNVSVTALKAWLDYLGLGSMEPAALGRRLERKTERVENYDFVQGWVAEDALSVLANSSDQEVRVPGTMRPHSIAVHPAPNRSVVIGWRSPQAATLTISGVVQHVHHACGNGVSWTLELRRGSMRTRLAAGLSEKEKFAPFGPLEKIATRAGDLVSLVISSRDGSHICDLTRVDLTLNDGTHEWNLTRDVSPNILAGNPHADGHGNADVWQFYSESTRNAPQHVIPAKSLLAKWQSATDAEQSEFAAQIQKLVQNGPTKLPPDAPDALLYQQLTSFRGPLMTAALQAIVSQPVVGANPIQSPFGVAASLFGKHPDGSPVESASLCVQAPAVLKLRLPAALVAGAEFVTTGMLHDKTGSEGSVQLQLLETEPAETAASSGKFMKPGTVILTNDGSAARRRLETAFAEFRDLFPPALCYTKIVPVDEVVTLKLFYREDDQLQRLMLTEEQIVRLDQLWDELLYIAREPLEMVTVFEQLVEFGTQDNPRLVQELTPLRPAMLERANRFRQRLLETEPRHLEAVLALAEQAWRRTLTGEESAQLRALYAALRQQELPHDDAIRLTLARVFVAPAFLYHIEKPEPGRVATPISDWELASRLSYFLWSSQPDAELRQLAEAGRLHDPEVLVAQTRRMLRDAKIRRLAIEFACQWLHIHSFDELDEKSERHFPTFAALRGAMYEESILFLTDLFQHDRPVLNLLDADYTYLNQDLAAHYRIPGVTGPEWRRVEGVGKFSRGGILTQAAPLAKQAGASRTSPILRGTWLSEVVLGEKLPRPPKGIPPLAESVPAGLTERQLTELHTTNAQCATCHVRIDPFGFALENFDAIGRLRERDANGLLIDPKTTLPDGTAINGLAGLRDYLLTTRRDAFLRQFYRKLLGYSLGRAVLLSDEPLLDELLQRASNRQPTISPIIEAIVLSPQFRHIRGRDLPSEE